MGLDTSRKSRVWLVKAGGWAGRRAKIAAFWRGQAWGRPANFARLALRAVCARSQSRDLVLAQVLAVEARLRR